MVGHTRRALDAHGRPSNHEPQLTPEELQNEVYAEALRNYVPDSAEEKALVRRVDFILLPILWWMYILAYLDRGNIVSVMDEPRQTASSFGVRRLETKN